jgi:hypothetical protein
MKNRFNKYVLILLLITPLVGFSQKIFSVEHESQSDIKVFVVKYESQCDLKVFKVEHESQGKGNEGL